MEEKRIQSYDDLSNERGFQFEFFCEHCRKSYKSKFVESKHYNAAQRKRNAGAAASFLGNILGGVASAVGDKIDEGLNSINDHTDDALYEKEKEAAFKAAEAEAKKLLHQCIECQNWFCDECYNEKTKLCHDCFENRKEIEKEEREWAEAQKREKAPAKKPAPKAASKTKKITCPECGAEVENGMKFCGQCGAKIDQKRTCPECGKEVAPGMKFCGYCGAKME